MMRILILSILLACPMLNLAQAETPKAKHEIPYLGPGADKLSKDEYFRIYSQYIKESIQLGYPPRICAESQCLQSLSYLFSSSGLFTYPVPTGADIKIWKHPGGLLECYETGGTVAQVEREKGGALLGARIVFSKSPKAASLLSKACREGALRVDREAATGLERVAGIPVGYPHPLLCSESQGLILRQLDFNNDRSDCRAIAYSDNAWASQLRLTENSCSSTQEDLKRAVQYKIAPSEFARRERMRQEERVREVVKARGGKEFEAAEIIKKYYSGPLSHDITLVGQAMRNIENCNQLLIGNRIPVGEKTPQAKPSPSSPDSKTGQ